MNKRGSYNRDKLPPNCPLSVAELEVIRVLATGIKPKEAATKLKKSINTLRFQVYSASKKLGVNSYLQVIFVTKQNGWLDYRPKVPVQNQIKSDKKQDKLTPAQQIYIDAFTRLLYSRSDEDGAIMEASYRLMRCSASKKLDRSEIKDVEAAARIDDMLIRIGYAISGGKMGQKKSQKRGPLASEEILDN